MGAATRGGKGFKETARVSGERPIGTASSRQQYAQASCPLLRPTEPHATCSMCIRLPDASQKMACTLCSNIYPGTTRHPKGCQKSVERVWVLPHLTDCFGGHNVKKIRSGISPPFLPLGSNSLVQLRPHFPQHPVILR